MHINKTGKLTVDSYIHQNYGVKNNTFDLVSQDVLNENIFTQTNTDLVNHIPTIIATGLNTEYTTPTIVATGLNTEYAYSELLEDSLRNLATNSVVNQPNTLVENTFDVLNDNISTFEHFLTEKTTIGSIEEFIVSDIETASQLWAAYVKTSATSHEHIRSIQTILFVVILVSIFSQQFGGNRSLPLI